MPTPDPLTRTFEGPLHRDRSGRWLAVYACIAALATTAVLAQDNQNEKRGFDAESLYSVGEIDTVNLFNAGLSMVIPISRFTSVDPVLGDPAMPQSWNRYTYALNNPLKYIDPDGQEAKAYQGGIVIDHGLLGDRIVYWGEDAQVWATNYNKRQTFAGLMASLAVVLGVTDRGGMHEDAQRALDEIESGDDRPNVRNPKTFENDGRSGSEVLPETDSDGNPIEYTEHTVNPRQPGKQHDGKRIVRGSDGNAYYTDDHFKTFHRVEERDEERRER